MAASRAKAIANCSGIYCRARDERNGSCPNAGSGGGEALEPLQAGQGVIQVLSHTSINKRCTYESACGRARRRIYVEAIHRFFSARRSGMGA